MNFKQNSIWISWFLEAYVYVRELRVRQGRIGVWLVLPLNLAYLVIYMFQRRRSVIYGNGYIVEYYR